MEEKIKERLEQMNPWWNWQNSEKEKFFGFIKRRTHYIESLRQTLDQKFITILTGLRRSGKTFLMYDLINYLLNQQTFKYNLIYLHLEDTIISRYNIQELLSEILKLPQIKKDRKIFLFLDEIQYSKNWDLALKVVYDLYLDKIKIVVSGSSAGLIKKRKNYLTGREITYEITPLSFREYLDFTGEKDKADLLLLEEYIKIGGFPEMTTHFNPNYMNELLDNLIAKDIAEVYNVKHSEQIKELMVLLAERVGANTSLVKLKNILRLSIETVRKYLNYLKWIYLVYEVPKFSPSLNERIYSNKKYYFPDISIKTALSGFKDLGGIVENLLFLYLKQRFKEVYYLEVDNLSIDFLVRQNGQLQIYESKYLEGELRYEDLENVYQFLKQLSISSKGRLYYLKDKIKEVFIITKDIDKVDSYKGYKIMCSPLYKLLL